MRILYWNIRGFGAKGRRSQIVELIRKYNLDGVCLQETIRSRLTDRELQNLSGGRQFWWSWIPAQGHSGGLLLGISEETFEVLDERKKVFSQSVQLIRKGDGATFELVNVYGPVQDSRKTEFLHELESIVEEGKAAIMIGGD